MYSIIGARESLGVLGMLVRGGRGGDWSVVVRWKFDGTFDEDGDEDRDEDIRHCWWMELNHCTWGLPQPGPLK